MNASEGINRSTPAPTLKRNFYAQASKRDRKATPAWIAGVARLAPFYDITAMSFAPRHDELPDDHVTRFPPPSTENAPLVDALKERLRGDPRVSRAFVDLWASRLQKG